MKPSSNFLSWLQVLFKNFDAAIIGMKLEQDQRGERDRQLEEVRSFKEKAPGLWSLNHLGGKKGG